LVAVMELHTYSSLNKDFMKEYAGAMNDADVALVYYSNHALEIKKMPPLDENMMKEAFQRNDLKIINEPGALKDFLYGMQWDNTNLLMMSSGSFDGLNWPQLAANVVG
jgi:UDP-N-acetylmuramate: L-alanyl-gamma-D-glutamyl-meso-diaminopimelate ligase